MGGSWMFLLIQLSADARDTGCGGLSDAYRLLGCPDPLTRCLGRPRGQESTGSPPDETPPRVFSDRVCVVTRQMRFMLP